MAMDASEKSHKTPKKAQERQTKKVALSKKQTFHIERWWGLTPSSASCLPPPPPRSPLDSFPVRPDAISDCLGKARSSTSEKAQGSDTCNKQSSVPFHPAPKKSVKIACLFFSFCS